ncbi:MAG TPA: hypothetical protein VI386_22270, partial [Candidatus Sulfotelmatobacter sp.]
GVEVTVEHVAAIEQKEMLQADYGSAQEKFRRVSNLKKELDRRPPIRKSLLTSPAPRRASVNAGGSAAAAKAAKVGTSKDIASMPAFHAPVITSQQMAAEEGKLRRVEESIRVFVRVADPKYRQIVPMRYFNLTLSNAEADAYNADFLEEKSQRAEIARTLIRLVSILARLGTELEELKRSQSMPSVWKLHADALVVLMDMAGSAIEEAGTMTKTVENIDQTTDTTIDGTTDTPAWVSPVQESVQKLRLRADIAVKALAHGTN